MPEVNPRNLAFPCTVTVIRTIGKARDGTPIGQPHDVQAPGLTKADWFAGMALQGMLAAGEGRGLDYAQLAAHAFGLGVAMENLSSQVSP